MALQEMPYEVLNAKWWQAGHASDGGGASSDDDFDRHGDEDEWAEGYSTTSSNPRATPPGSRGPAPSIRPPLPPSQEHVATDQGEWQTVSRGSKTKLPIRGNRSHTQGIATSNAGQAPIQKKIGKPSTSQPPPQTAQPTHRVSTQTFRPKQPLESSNVVRKGPTSTPHRPPIYHFPRDNAAKAAYRRRQQPTDQFVLHKDVDEIGPDQTTMSRFLDELGVRHKTFLWPQEANDRTILIWGENRDVARTMKALRAWIRATDEGPAQQRSRAKEQFFSAKSTVTHTYKKEQRRMKRETLLRSFQQVPEPGRHFQFQGWVIWNDEDETSPFDVFGTSLEAFDPIRSGSRCHIIFHEQIQALRILAHSKESVDVAVQRIEVAIEGFRAQSRKSTREFVVDIAQASHLQQDICLREDTSQTKGPVLIPSLTGISKDPLARSKWIEQSRNIHSANENRIKHALKRIIPPLRYYSGQLRLRLLFGIFGLTKFPLPEGPRLLPLEALLEKITMPGIRGTLIRDVKHNKDSSVTMKKLLAATDLFEPRGATNVELGTVLPIVGGHFVIHRFDRPSVQFDIEFSAAWDGSWDASQSGTWSRHDRKDEQTPLEIFMISLEGNTSWQLAVTKEQHLDKSRIDPQMAAFANSVKLKSDDINNAFLHGRRQIAFDPGSLGALKPSTFEQKIGYRYRLKFATQWLVEIARYDTYKADGDNPVSTNWAASMFNADWDETTAQNIPLAIGECATWEPSLSKFLPARDLFAEEGQGVVELLQNVRLVTNFLDEMAKE